MKKLTLVFFIILSIFLVSCGGDKSDKKKDSAKAESSVEIAVLDTQEAMVNKLKELNVMIPEGLNFRDIKESPFLDKNYDQQMAHTIYFNADTVNETKKAELDSWLEKQFTTLTSDGWTEKDNRKDQEMMGGGVYSTFAVTKTLKGNIDCKLTVGTSYNSEKRYTIHASPKFSK